ncbi:hypothetical protein [Candidatus Enterovibrio escicola]|uniref:Uncharacterized protein n=1 Tax=Candidatus Enterovibrio escicola TaxID=1927127 RepID=A0A2A5T092_9GAMM|nr:hypothetical protein [Candidatus Enterovibrio escacola]PCS21550.1 hypothetical protein BTN49_3091 [Candidatus Enterovibrio escacola]
MIKYGIAITIDTMIYQQKSAKNPVKAEFRLSARHEWNHNCIQTILILSTA